MGTCNSDDRDIRLKSGVFIFNPLKSRIDGRSDFEKSGLLTYMLPLFNDNESALNADLGSTLLLLIKSNRPLFCGEIMIVLVSEATDGLVSRSRLSVGCCAELSSVECVIDVLGIIAFSWLITFSPLGLQFVVDLMFAFAVFTFSSVKSYTSFAVVAVSLAFSSFLAI